MPRTKTAEQVKKNRRLARIVLILAAVLLCAGAGVLAWLFLRKEPVSGPAPMLAKYQMAEPGGGLAKEALPERPALFGEGLCVVSGNSEEDPAITAKAGICFDRTTGQVIFSKNAYERLYPASITKLMTCLVTLRHGDLSQKVTVEEYMLSNLDPDSSLCHVSPGCTLTLEQLLYGLMLPSGNDAANVIAYGVAGSEEAFAELMNQEARRIGATDSHFVNAHGLNDPEHYTTAYDIYLMLNELMEYDTFVEIITAPSYKAVFEQNGAEAVLEWQRGIWYFTGQAQAPEGVQPLGGKTGTTPEAGFCLSLVSLGASGDQYVTVVLDTLGRDELYSNMTALLSKIPN